MGEWDDMYADVTEWTAYGPDAGYVAAAQWVESCATVEDWGCGMGWMRNFIPPERYRGIDGSHSPFADEVVDLRTYRSEVNGIVMRGVLEHNDEWRSILVNACVSFTSRMALVLFTPLERETWLLRVEPNGVPTRSFALPDIVDVLHDRGLTRWHVRIVLTPGTEFGYETAILVER